MCSLIARTARTMTVALLYFGARGLFPNDFGLHLECSHFEAVLFRGYNLEGNYTAKFEDIWKGVEALLGRITKRSCSALKKSVVLTLSPFYFPKNSLET